MHFAGLMTNKKEFNFFFIECNSNKLLWISFFFKGGQFFNLPGDTVAFIQTKNITDQNACTICCQ